MRRSEEASYTSRRVDTSYIFPRVSREQLENIIVNHLALLSIQLLEHIKPGKVINQDRCVHLDIFQILLAASIPAIVKTVVEDRLEFIYS